MRQTNDCSFLRVMQQKVIYFIYLKVDLQPSTVSTWDLAHGSD